MTIQKQKPPKNGRNWLDILIERVPIIGRVRVRLRLSEIATQQFIKALIWSVLIVSAIYVVTAVFRLHQFTGGM